MATLHPDASMVDMGHVNGDLMNGDIMNSMGVEALSMNMPMDLGGSTEDQIYSSIEPASTNLPALTHQDSTGSSNNTAANVMTGAGAGPLPTGFGVHSTSNTGSAGSTLTEFTKRRNWSQRVLEELKDFLFILTPDGRLLYVSPSSKALTGYSSQDLVGKFIVDYIHTDDSSIFIREFNESIATGNPLRFFYRFKTADGAYTIFESHGHPHLTSDATSYGPTNGNTPGFCRGFFMMSRPYPTKNAELLDSFLEHKIENERLQRRIAALRREEAEEADAQARHYHKKVNGHESLTPSESLGGTGGGDGNETPGGDSGGTGASGPAPTNPMDHYSGMPPPAKPTISNTALTQQNLDEANASSRPDSITDKMARYEGATHIEGIEMITGLNYRSGERSHGLSTGDTSPALIRGDAGIAISIDKTSAALGLGAGASGSGVGVGGDKKKKLKAADEYVCTDCGTLDSPEWRKGPNGPKTLCNACGLRWAKKEKKRTSSGGGGGGGGGGGVLGSQNSGQTRVVNRTSSGSG